ncbi:helix-turn-helix domain-containing protein [Actinomadura rugatobispora]|uniref:Helix-turn-helix domain-containing protein n=1 Tax=Actinomadura rugatobispora TaxID=1994 RepID=A0ABW1A7J1_9ACTN
MTPTNEPDHLPNHRPDTESLAELRRWLDAVGALTAAVNSGRGLREVLDLIAETARSLLGLDFCGVLVPDAAGRNLVIAGWSGLTEEYVARVNSDRPVRLETGARGGAPSSRAFRSGRPVAVADISAEPDFSWAGVAREQGYRSMLSVPLVTGPAVVGTLNSYHSAVHDFTPLEIDRLRLLADHAAIALTSARMLDDLRHQHELVTRSERIHESLLRVALRAGGVDGIAAAVSDLLARPVLVEDARGEVMAHAGPLEDLPGAEIRSTSTARPGTDLVRQHGEHVVIGVLLEGSVVARLWLPRGTEPLTPLDERALEHASIVLSLELFRLRTAAEVEQRLRGELLADILGGTDPASGPLRERAELLGHDLSRPHLALVCRIEPAQTALAERALAAVTHLASGFVPRPLVALHRQALVVLWPAEDARPREIGERVRKALTSVPGVTEAMVAVSAPAHHGIVQSYRTALGALTVAARAGRPASTVTVDDLGIGGLLLQLDDSAQLLAFADRTLADVRHHDRERGTELLHTLRVHLDAGLDRRETARRLNVHPNTVSQRLRRIETVSGLDLSQPETVVNVRAALVLLDVAEGAAP